ncbi:hypothetical protein [Xanthomonas arboricola]|uniref:hypothetical protein n=1 Tax=Xanthomonas arboricola TaxID=56448 RepID=UPI0020185364|nr:hypothetical protein [Xanthomonas arboricola]UQQ14431.1 hypothetical protein KPG65_18480 [Xanthomonas arboricola pv. corylina]
MNSVPLRRAVGLVLALGIFGAANFASAETFPLPEFPCNCGEEPPYGGGLYNAGGSLDDQLVPSPQEYGAAANPYPATCGSSRAQRFLHAKYDIDALNKELKKSIGFGNAYRVTYDDGLEETYASAERAGEVILLGIWMPTSLDIAPQYSDYTPDICRVPDPV